MDRLKRAFTQARPIMAPELSIINRYYNASVREQLLSAYNNASKDEQKSIREKIAYEVIGSYMYDNGDNS